jgi:hypothetical protein
MHCSKQIKLKGGFTYTVRTARDDYPCFYCGKPIKAGTVYIEERILNGVVRRYHYKCLNNVMKPRVWAEEAPSGVVLCQEGFGDGC